jgi:hypothetical protein
MAALIRIIAISFISSWLFAQEYRTSQTDSVKVDTATSITISDSTFSASREAKSAWLIPLALISATGGIFVLLFTTRSK